MDTIQKSKTFPPIFIGRWTPKILFSLKGRSSSARAIAPPTGKRVSAHAY